MENNNESGAMLTPEQVEEIKVFSIEELISYHAETIHRYDGTGDQLIEQMGINFQAIHQTISNLKIFKELYTSKNSENYVVSMGIDQYKKFQEFKEFLNFKSKTEENAKKQISAQGSSKD